MSVTHLLSRPQPRPLPEAQPLPAHVQVLPLLVSVARHLEPRALHGDVQQLLGHRLVGSFQVPDEERGEVFVALREEGVGGAARAWNG